MDTNRRIITDRGHVNGAFDKAKEAIEDAAGKIRGDSDLQAGGRFDKAKGAAANGLRDALRSDSAPIDHELSIDDE